MKKHPLQFLDIPDGILVGVFVVVIIALSVYAVLSEKNIPGGVVAVFSTVIGALAAKRAVKAITGDKAKEKR